MEEMKDKQYVEESEEITETPHFKIKYFHGVNSVRSLNRAIRRGLLTTEGMEMPKKPFNNRANTSKRKNVHSRVMNEIKKGVYKNIERLKMNYLNSVTPKLN